MKKNERLKCFPFNGLVTREDVVIFGIPTFDEIEPLLLTAAAFNQIDITETIKIPEVKPDVEQINQMQLQVCLKDAWFTTSNQKIFIKGVIWQKVTYTSCDKDQPVHTVEKDFSFSHFVDIPSGAIIPPGADPFDLIVLVPEDAFIQMENGRTLFKNVLVNALLFVDVMPPS